MESGLYDELVDGGLLIPHCELIDRAAPREKQAYKIIQPEKIPFISYPYEWCFSQLKSAALLTLDVQRKAMARGMSLKDCSAFNIQFKGYQPVLIDTLSFTHYRKGTYWQAYRQFCQHFLAPLALMSMVDVRLNNLSQTFLDGIPLDLASRLLPTRSHFNLSLLMHIHLHAGFQKKYQVNQKGKVKAAVTQNGMLGIIDNLYACISALNCKPQDTHWANYYARTNYSSPSMEDKRRKVSSYLELAAPITVWDVGCNRGDFSQIASAKGANVISFDSDHASIEMNYMNGVKTKASKLLPLIIDISNPTPAVGWNGEERQAFVQRGPADVIMALAVLHHLVIAGGIPLRKIAELFAEQCTFLIVEFIPKSDTYVKDMLQNREDIFFEYTHLGFLNAFEKYFRVIKEDKLRETERTVFLMKSRR